MPKTIKYYGTFLESLEIILWTMLFLIYNKKMLPSLESSMILFWYMHCKPERSSYFACGYFYFLFNFLQFFALVIYYRSAWGVRAISVECHCRRYVCVLLSLSTPIKFMEQVQNISFFLYCYVKSDQNFVSGS